MNNKIKFALIGLSALPLCSCVIPENSTTDSLSYPAYSWYDDSQMYQKHPYNIGNFNDSSRQGVVVPESYHVGEMRRPVSFHDREQSWVSSQNPQAYTIELTEGDEAAKVARVLYKTPKHDRMAQVKYERDGKEYYRGVYGSYNSAVEAQKALDALPPEIRGGASIKNWSSVRQ